METVAGNPFGIRELAQNWVQQGQAADTAAVTLRSAKNNIEGGALALQGDFAPKIRDAIGDLPQELEKLGRGYRGCGQALDRFATRLTEAQQKSRQANSDWEVADRSRRNAEYDLDTLAPGWDAWAQNPTALRTHLADKGEPALAAVTRRENSDRDVSLAESLSRQAAALRGDAERDCVREINDALDDSGLKNRTWYQKVGDYLKESFTTWDGFVKFCETMSMVLGVVAIFLSGPLALVVGAVLLVMAAVALADKIKKFADGEIGWKELAFEAVMVVAARFGGRALGPAFRRLSNTKAISAFSKQVHKGADRLAGKLKLGDRSRNLAHRAICTVTGHPVDIATGKVFTEVTDLALPGPLPLRFERAWFSTSTYRGPLGHGWHHSFDAALYATADTLLYRTSDGRSIELVPLYPDTQYYDRTERITLTRDATWYRIRTADGVTLRFAPRADAAEEVVVHLLQDVTNPAGQRLSLSYDEVGRLAEIVDSGGRGLEFEHDDQGRLRTLTAPHPDHAGERFTVARYHYDDAGDLVAVDDALDQQSRYEYDGHLLVRESDRVGLSFYFTYEGTGEHARCVRTWGDGGIYDRTLTYQPGRTTVRNGLGAATEYEHENGLVVSVLDALGAQTRIEYDYQQPVRYIDGIGRVTTYEYDHRGNQTRATTADGASVIAVFDERDIPLQATDRIGGDWHWEHDAAEQLVEVRDPLGRRTRFDYRAGLLIGITDAAGGPITLDYDDQGSPITLTAADGAVTRWERNSLGWAVRATDPLGCAEQRQYDLLGRVVQVLEPDGNVRDLGYDAEGRLVSTRDLQEDIQLRYQGQGRIVSRTQAGTTVRFEYDVEEQLTGIVNQHGQVYGFTYGPTGLVSTERGFDDILRLYERDGLGRVVTLRRAGGRFSRYEYNALDRVTLVAHSDGTTEQFTFRADDELLSAQNDTTTVQFERDALGRVVREIQGDTWVDSEYDQLGMRLRMRSSLGADQRIERTAVGDVTGVGAGGFEARFTRDALGQELTLDLPGGVRSQWQRDHLGRPVQHQVSGVGGAVRDRSYTWEVNGRLASVTDAVGGPIGYARTPLGQLDFAEHADGTRELRLPDAVGNLFRSTDRNDRVYGPAGQLLESTDPAGNRTRYEYDPDGNLVSKQTPDGSWGYRWGADGTLQEVTRPDGTVVSFGYDALGRRVHKTYRGQTTRWVWDGDVPLHEWVEGDLAPALAPATGRPADDLNQQREARLSEFLRRGPPERGTAQAPITWLFEPESFTPLARLSATGQAGIVTDLNAPVAMLAEDGTVAWAGELSTWGELELRAGARWDCPFRWSGQYEDAETGLYYNRFRYYDPEFGQYISQDPIGTSGGLELYGYVPDPTAWIDSFGLSGQRYLDKVKLDGKPYAKPGPKTDPEAPHNKMIRQIIKDETDKGLDHIGGGTKTEKVLQTPGGFKPVRRPDVSFEDPVTKEITHHNVGMGVHQPIIREREALQDIRTLADPKNRNITYHSYTNPTTCKG